MNSQSNTMTIAFIHHHGLVEQYLHEAFARRCSVIHWGSDEWGLYNVKSNASILKLLERTAVVPSFILHCSDRLLPHDLNRVAIPTVCLLVDVFVGLPSRLRWAMLFDYLCVTLALFQFSRERVTRKSFVCLLLLAQAFLKQQIKKKKGVSKLDGWEQSKVIFSDAEHVLFRGLLKSFG